jgi:CheY-like chemotaxis protein
MAIFLLAASDGMASQETFRVLVVDDDPAIRTLVVTALRRNGFSVEAAKDGVEALAQLENSRFDLLVLDLMMPRLDGFGVVDRLYQKGAEVPKIMIMTAASPSVLRQVPKERVAKIITKPFDLSTLINSAKDLAENDK